MALTCTPSENLAPSIRPSTLVGGILRVRGWCTQAVIPPLFGNVRSFIPCVLAEALFAEYLQTIFSTPVLSELCYRQLSAATWTFLCFHITFHSLLILNTPSLPPRSYSGFLVSVSSLLFLLSFASVVPGAIPMLEHISTHLHYHIRASCVHGTLHAVDSAVSPPGLLAQRVQITIRFHIIFFDFGE